MSHHLLFNGSGALCALLLVLAPAVAAAQAQEVEKSALHEAFAQGDAQAVLAQATGRVEMDLPEGSSQYSRSQAVYVLQRFFKNHPPRRFSWQRVSTSKRSRFLSGRYWHEGAKQPLAVHLRLGKAKGGWQLQEVRVKRP